MAGLQHKLFNTSKRDEDQPNPILDLYSSYRSMQTRYGADHDSGRGQEIWTHLVSMAIRSVLEDCLTEPGPLPCIYTYTKVLYHLYAQDTPARDFIEHFR